MDTPDQLTVDHSQDAETVINVRAAGRHLIASRLRKWPPSSVAEC